MEASIFIFSANQWAGFYMVETSVIKEVILMFSDDENTVPSAATLL